MLAARTRTRNGTPELLGGWLRPSEAIAAELGCRVRVDGPHFSSGWAVIVKTKDGPDEDAAVFILVPQSPSACPSELRLVHVLPITSTLSLSLNQTPPSPSVSHFQLSARPHITLSLWSAVDKVDLRVSSDDVAQTHTFIHEVKRLVAIAKTLPVNPVRSSWLGYYPISPPIADERDEPPSTNGSSSSRSTVDLTAPGTASTSATALSTPMTSLSLMSPAGETTIETGTSTDDNANPLHPSFSRVAFLRRHVYRSESTWSAREPIKIRIATYNVNDRLPPRDTVELGPMVGKGEEDLLVFGFQEVDLRSHALLISQGNLRAEDWKSAILRGLGDKGDDFTCIATSQYVGVMMLVFIKKSLEGDVSGLETSERGIGLMGFGGNKAGVAVRLKLHDTTFCFVNSHLAAFTSALDRRRADYQSLKSGLCFSPVTGHEDVLAVDQFPAEGHGLTMGLEDSHAVFWMGDLNYRIDAPDEDIKRRTKDKDYGALLHNDQLKWDIASGKSFAGYQEGEIGFPPTYKYIHGSSTLDDRRAPAYTDRILWKLPPLPDLEKQSTYTSINSLPGSFPQGEEISPADSTADIQEKKEKTDSRHSVQCERYESHEILWSDHRPVTGTYSTDVRVVDVDKRRHAVSEARRTLERLEELWRPSLKIGRTEIDFGRTSYRRQAVQEIVIRNSGRVPASFSFREPGPDKPICKPYFWVYPSSAIVEPDQTLTLRIVAYVNESHARDLTAGSEMSDVLVLQVQDGKDTFITLSATFSPTIIGLPLDRLPTLSTYIRDMPFAERRSLVRARPRPRLTEDGAPPTPEKAPPGGVKAAGTKPAREVWRLLEYLMEYGHSAEQLWVGDGSLENELQVLDVIEAVDTGSEISETSSPLSVSLALLHILQCLPEPLLPRQWHPFCLGAKNRDEAFACLEGVQGVHTNILIGLMSVIRLRSAKSGTSAGEEGKQVDGYGQNLVAILASTIFGSQSDGTSVSAVNIEGRQRFVRLLLEG